MRKLLSRLEQLHPSLFQDKATLLQKTKKYYRSHVWITQPNHQQQSFFGISEWAKVHFTVIDEFIDVMHPRTKYGIANREKIIAFLAETQTRRANNTLRLSEKMELDRFVCKQGESFGILRMNDFEVQLQAPVDLAMVDITFQIQHLGRFFETEQIGKVRVINPKQLQGLMTQQEYNRSPKLFQL